MILNSCNQKVSVTPPDSPPPNGYIYITSNPKEFHIYLDGKARRRATPDSLKWLKTGTYLITLKKDLFRDTSFSADIVEGIKKSKFVDLTKDPLMLGRLYCDSRPEGAEIFVNDSSTGKLTPYTLKNIIPAYYEVRYHLKNHSDDSVNVPVSSNNLSKTFKILVDTTLWTDYTEENSGIGGNYLTGIRSNYLTCINIDKQGVIWVGTDSLGVKSFDGYNWGGQYIYPALPGKEVTCIAVNTDNTKFIGTGGGFVTHNGTMETVYGPYGTEILPSLFVTAINFDNADNWYFGTTGGLTQSGISNGIRYWYTYSTNQLLYSWITAVFYDTFGNLWVGMHDKGIAKMDSYGNWKTINTSTNSIINNYVRAFAESPSREIWVGFGKETASGGGLSYYNGTSWQNVYTLPPSCQTNAIFIDQNDVKWVATDQGLVRFTNSADVTVFNYDNTGLNINDATGVAQDSRNNIWISTYGGGLIEYKGNH